MDSPYPERVDQILQGLGIPPDYGKDRRMRLQEEATELAIADLDPDGAQVLLTPPAASAWGRLRDAARKDGVELVVYSGFRSVERQAQIVRNKLERGRSLAEILRYVAAPGYSEHHTGRAIDIGAAGEAPLVEAFEDTDAYRWLATHAANHCFRMSYPRFNHHGIGYEPWHWCYR